jgi:prolyl-tRNA editing enzyme YbaK/EbsC (Cys-tRNA(Pro) deacylase)
MEWPETVERVAAALRESAVEAWLEEFPAAAPNGEAAAEAVGSELAQIVKSLVFVCDPGFVLAMIPGDRRADAAKVASAVGSERARIATAEEVFAATGVEPGAVAPFPNSRVVRVLLERTLLAHEIVWVGAGSPRHVAGLAPADLMRVANASLADLTA